MKFLWILLLGAVCLTTSCTRKPDPGFAVVELFTSEGCSSCPPADKVLADLDARYPGRVFALGFHVTYWDRQGWKDKFSNPAYSERQRQYACVLSLKDVYTPQAIVNGRQEAIGSDRNRLETLVRSALAVDNTVVLEGQVAGAWKVHYHTDRSGVVVNAALMERHAQSEVTAGENSGSTLTHVNIVRAFASGNGPTGDLELTSDLAPGDARLFLYAQDTATGRVLKAIEVPLH